MSSRKKVLVTGGAGYVGSVLVPKLLEKGYNVKVFDQLLYGSESLDAVKGRIEIVQGNIVDPPSDLCQGMWGVIHLAGFSNEPSTYYRPRYTDHVNHLGAEKIARMAKAEHVQRFLFASSCSVYFTYDTPLVPPLYKEDCPINSISAYALTKRAAEEALLELAHADFQPIIFRKGTVYGFSPKMRYDLVLNAFVKDAFREKKLRVNANGVIYRPMLDIQDAILAYLAFLELPLHETGGRIFNVLTKNWNITDLANLCRDTLKTRRGAHIDIEIQSTGIARNYLADDSKFKKVCMEGSARPIEEAITEMWDALQAGHNSQDPRYYPDIHLKRVLS